MFYIALLFLLLLLAFTAIIVVQNFGELFSTGIQLVFLSWHLPALPVLLLCLVGVFLGGLLLYVFAAYAARRDVLRLKELRARIEELETLPAKTPSGGLTANFAPPVVPIPGFPSSAAGPVPGPGPLGAPAPASAPVNQLNFPPGGPMGPGGPFNQAGPIGSPEAPGQRQPPANTLQNISPSSSGSNLSLPPRLFRQRQPQEMDGQRPPFPRS